MMKLDYAGGEVLVSNALCHVLVEYSAHIARSGGSESLIIPVLTLDGIQGNAEVVVGPASQLLATPTDVPDVELGDQEIIADILGRTALLKPAHPLPVTDATFDAAADLEL